MTIKQAIFSMAGTILAASIFLGPVVHADEKPTKMPIYDESAYTERVENTMNLLNKLYLDFCDTCNVDGAKAAKARIEYLTTVRDLLGYMNSKFDNMDPKAGAALSHTEVLVSIHVLTMLTDILTATAIQNLSEHPYLQ